MSDDEDEIPDDATIERMIAEAKAKEEAEKKAKQKQGEDGKALAEYALACTKLQVVQCSQWKRACTSCAPEVSLSHYGLGARGAEALATSLAFQGHVESLDLSDNGLGASGVVAIVEVLKSGGAPSLRTLSLKQNQCGQEGADALAALFGASAHALLSSVDLGANGLGSKGAAAIAEGLASNTTLTSLSLEHNEIESEGVEKLVSLALCQNSTLTSLSLEWNNVGPPGGKALADAIAKEQMALSSLNLGWNGLGDEGAAELARALEARPADGPLRDVRLHHNRLSSAAAPQLSKCLGGLSVMDVSGNALGQGGSAVLLVAQQEMRLVTDEATGDTSEHRCRLMMDDVCVRPDTVLAGLVMRTSSGGEISSDEMAASKVREMATAALKEEAAKGGAGGATPRPASKAGAKKGGSGAKQQGGDWERDVRPAGQAKGKAKK